MKRKKIEKKNTRLYAKSVYRKITDCLSDYLSQP